MTCTVVEITPRGAGVSCALAGELVIPRLVRREGRSVEVALVAGRAMLLPGDEVAIRVSVGEGCTLSLVDVGGLVVYGRPGGSGPESRWHARIDLAAGAQLRWEGLPTVVTDAGALARSVVVRLAPGSSALLRETLVLGRSGERGGVLRSDTDAADDAGPILREALEVSGHDPTPGLLGRTRVMDSILALGEGLAVADVPGAARLAFERGGTVLRYLGEAAHDSPLRGLDTQAVRLERETADVA